MRVSQGPNGAAEGSAEWGVRRRFRAVRGAYAVRGVNWEVLSAGSTNQLWRGRHRLRDWLLKWYRYPQPGVHPEAEVAAFLAGQPGVAVAPFGGSLEERLPGGGVQTVALLQGWVEGEVGWQKVLESLRGGSRDGRRLCERVRLWGRQLGQLHRALASGEAGSAFDVAPWGEEERLEWSVRVEKVGEALQGVLGGTPPSQVDQTIWRRAQALWNERETCWRGKVRALRTVSAWGVRSRIHGDMHLGQLLDTVSHGAVFVDFEGEPLRSLAERRLRDLPLRDVAGMWRSFAYAGAVAGTNAAVVRGLQEALVEGWTQEMKPPEGDWQSLLEGLVWEKAIYETWYEITHRPDWLEVPLAALA